MRKSESIEDTARVLSRYVDAIVIRTFAQKDVEDLAAAASVPVINALTDDDHPCQALADIFTFRERFPDCRGPQDHLPGRRQQRGGVAGRGGGHGRASTCVLCVPEGCDLPPAKMAAHRSAWPNAAGHAVWVERDPVAAVGGASALYTDVWISMGQQRDAGKIEALRPYQVNHALLAQGAARGHRAALPAGAPGRGDHRRGHGRSAVGGVRPGREPAARAEGAHGLPAGTGADAMNKRQRQQLIRRVLREQPVSQPAGAGGRPWRRRAAR